MKNYVTLIAISVLLSGCDGFHERAIGKHQFTWVEKDGNATEMHIDHGGSVSIEVKEGAGTGECDHELALF